MIANNIKERFDNLDNDLKTIDILRKTLSNRRYLTDPLTTNFIKSLDGLINDINELGKDIMDNKRNSLIDELISLMDLKIKLKYTKLAYDLVPNMKLFYSNNKGFIIKDKAINESYAKLINGALFEVKKLEEHGLEDTEDFNSIKRLLKSHHYDFVIAVKLVDYLTQFRHVVGLGKSVFEFKPELAENLKMTLNEGIKDVNELESLMSDEEFKPYIKIRNKLQSELDELKAEKKTYQDLKKRL